MNFLYPRIRLASLPAMFAYAIAGAILAGAYGVLHDQITYSISPEYFTRLKFAQFHWADCGLPRRVFVAEIGFLATWWVGLFAAWFLARITVSRLTPRAAFQANLRGFLIVFACGIAAGMVGYLLGFAAAAHPNAAWQDLAAALQVSDVPSFVRVAYIHNASYLGGFVGLVVALIYVWRRRGS